MFKGIYNVCFVDLQYSVLKIIPMLSKNRVCQSYLILNYGGLCEIFYKTLDIFTLKALCRGLCAQAYCCSDNPLFFVAHLLPAKTERIGCPKRAHPNAKKERWTSALFELSYPDSNQNRQNQKLQCYHYTIRQS